MDYGTAILSGLFTGIGVILAQKMMSWLETHPLTRFFTDKANHYLGQDEKQEKKTKRGR